MEKYFYLYGDSLDTEDSLDMVHFGLCILSEETRRYYGSYPISRLRGIFVSKEPIREDVYFSEEGMDEVAKKRNGEFRAFGLILNLEED